LPKEVQFNLKKSARSAALLCGTTLKDGTAALGGRRGTILLASPSGQMLPLTQGSADIHSVADLGDGRLALGTQEGLMVVAARTADRSALMSSYNERVTAVG